MGAQNEPLEVLVSHLRFPSKTDNCVDEFFEISDVGLMADCQHPACAQQLLDTENVYKTCQSDTFHRFTSRTALVQVR